MEVKITRLIQELNRNGRNIPTEIWDVEDLGYQFFDELIDDASKGKIKILRHSREMQSSLFSMLSEPREKIIGFIGQLLFWCGLPVSIILVYMYSWWFLVIAVVTYFMGSKLITSAYNSTIFKTSTQYEAGFCLLYYIGQISVGNPDNYKIAFYEGE